MTKNHEFNSLTAMDFFTATREHSAAPAPVAAAVAGHGLASGREPAMTMDATTPEVVDAFAEAISARYSRAGTSLIPLSPNQHGSTTPNVPLVQPGPAMPTLPFTLTMPTRAAPSPASVLSLHPPPPPRRSSPLATTTTSRATPASGEIKPSLTSPASLPTSTSSSQPLPPSAFTALAPNALRPVLAESSILILDIRPHNAYAIARLPSALSLSVPSTLLKRPLFSLDRLAQMLSPSARTRFSTWPTVTKIVVYDADSTSLTEGGNILGLLRKLRKEGYNRDLCWLKGGFKAIWREHFDLVDQSAPAEEEDEQGELPPHTAPGVPQVLLQPTGNVPGVELSKTMSAPPTMAGFPQSVPPSVLLRTKNLPMSAFTSFSTTSTRPYRPGEPSIAASSTGVTYHGPDLGVNPSAVPSTPLTTKADPFASLGAASASSGPSMVFVPGTTPRPTSSAQALSLRLPPGMSRTPTSASASTIPEGQTMHAFPPRLGAIPSGGLTRGAETVSSLPTQGAGAAYGLAPRERQHHKSFPGVGTGQSVGTAVISDASIFTRFAGRSPLIPSSILSVRTLSWAEDVVPAMAFRSSCRGECADELGTCRSSGCARLRGEAGT